MPGREAAAYQHLRKIYEEDGAMHTPRLLSRLRNLENCLALPADQRIPSPEEQPSSPSR